MPVASWRNKRSLLRRIASMERELARQLGLRYANPAFLPEERLVSAGATHASYVSVLCVSVVK
jgi:hypothetical protein